MYKLMPFVLTVALLMGAAVDCARAGHRDSVRRARFSILHGIENEFDDAQFAALGRYSGRRCDDEAGQAEIELDTILTSFSAENGYFVLFCRVQSRNEAEEGLGNLPGAFLYQFSLTLDEYVRFFAGSDDLDETISGREPNPFEIIEVSARTEGGERRVRFDYSTRHPGQHNGRRQRWGSLTLFLHRGVLTSVELVCIRLAEADQKPYVVFETKAESWDRLERGMGISHGALARATDVATMVRVFANPTVDNVRAIIEEVASR